MSLDEQAASISTGTARTERDMLVSIQNGDLPRFIARVGPSNNFDRGTFANPNRPFAFAAEPADLRGISPAEAMYKVGWTREWIEPNIGKEIVIAVLDTQVPVPDASGGANHVEMGRMEWAELKTTALADPNFLTAAEAKGIDPAELPALFDIAASTPVKGTPNTSNPDQAAKVAVLRGLIDRSYGANELYTGMGATMRDDGQLGGREIMLRPNGTGLQLTADNHRKVSLGVMTREHFDALFPPPGTTPGSAPPAPGTDPSTTGPATTPTSGSSGTGSTTDTTSASDAVTPVSSSDTGTALPPPAPVAASPEATQHAKSVAGTEAKQATKKYVFDPAEEAAVNQRVRDKAQAAGEQPEGVLAELVARDANRSLDDPSDEGARIWLAQLAGRIREWMGDTAPPARS